MIHKMFLFLGFFGIFGVSFSVESPSVWRRIDKFFKDEIVPSEQKNNMSNEQKVPGAFQHAFCAMIVVPMDIARFIQIAMNNQESDDTDPWLWQKYKAPKAVDVASYSLVPWYAHAAHGYYQRMKGFQNNDLKKYSSIWQRVNVLDFETFNKWHPIQSMKSYKRMTLPLIGPIVAAHATGLAYHMAVEHSPYQWYSKKTACK